MRTFFPLFPCSFALLMLSACAKKPVPAITPSPEQAVQIPSQDMDKLERDRNRARVKSLADGVFQPLYFPLDRADLSPEALERLAAAGKLMKQESILSVILEGHADERGTEEYNLALGERRAQAVKDYLGSFGVESHRLRTLSYGEERPAAQGGDEAAWSRNRRVEFQVAID